MSSNIYEDPLLTTNVRYNKGGKEDGVERVERMVAIYESADALEDRRVDPSTQDGGTNILNLVESTLSAGVCSY